MPNDSLKIMVNVTSDIKERRVENAVTLSKLRDPFPT